MMKKTAEEAVLEAEAEYQITLDYSKESLKTWHNFRKIRSSFKENKPEDKILCINAIIYGAYVGETFKKILGGHG